jgi:hypothetical protein
VNPLQSFKIFSINGKNSQIAHTVYPQHFEFSKQPKRAFTELIAKYHQKLLEVDSVLKQKVITLNELKIIQ